MKLKSLAVACAMMAAGSAFAAGTVTIGGVPHQVVYLSGATAVDNFLGDIAESMLTGVTFYQNVSSNGSFQHRGYAGTANGIPGITNGTRLLFIKRTKGGSVWGVNPVARAQRIETIDVNNCNSGAGTKALPFICGVVGIDPGVANHGTSANTGLVPDYGVSDVEPAMFAAPLNTENDTPALSPDEVARLAAVPLNQLMMGIVATNTVPLSTHISRSAYGAMLNGQIGTWDQVDPSLSGDVAVCRRVEGSGTQTSYNWFFSNFPCAANEGGAQTPARMSDSFGYKVSGSGTEADRYIIDPSAGYTVVENSGSGDVRNCLKAANAGTDFDFKAWDSDEQKENFFRVVFSSSGPMKAIGTLSLDSYGREDGWTFRNLDGAGSFNAATQTASAGSTGMAPSKANLINGKYDFVVEVSMQGRQVPVSNEQGDSIPALAGVQKAFFDEFVKRAGSPKFTGNFENSGTQVGTPNAFASLPQYFAGLTNGQGAETNAQNVRFADLYVSRFSRDANTCAPMKFLGN